MYDNSRTDGTIRLPSRRRFLTLAGGAAAASLATGSAVAGGSGGGGGSDESEAQPFSAIEFSNQMSDGTEIVVDATVLSDGGYVAIHDGTLFEGKVTESVIGVSEYLDPGAHYRVPVTLFDVPGANFDQSSLEGTSPLVPMPHMETSGNETYDFVTSGGADDGPYAEAELPAVDAGLVSVGEQQSGGDDGSFATVDFENQSVSEGSLTVREATLSDGGFVTLHDARLLAGKAVESVIGVSEYMEAGRHQAVEVTVDDPSSITEVALPARPVLPMPHLDTNGNQKYDFVESQGSDDGPYTKAGQAVIDAGLVVVDE